MVMPRSTPSVAKERVNSKILLLRPAVNVIQRLSVIRGDLIQLRDRKVLFKSVVFTHRSSISFYHHHRQRDNVQYCLD